MDFSISNISSTSPNSAQFARKGPVQTIHSKVIHEFGKGLTNEKRDSILNTIDSMNKNGESFRDIQYVVDGFLEENGIIPPSQYKENGLDAHNIENRGVLAKLSGNQLFSVIEEIKDLKTLGLNPDEMRDKLSQYLSENGISSPSRGGLLIDVFA